MNAIVKWRPEIDHIYCWDALSFLSQMETGSVNCIVTSPPYFGLRQYLPDGHPDMQVQIGLEDTPQAFVDRLVDVFREAKRVLRDDGTLWLNLGDSYNSGAQFNNGRSSTVLATQGKIYRESVDDRKWPGHRSLIPGLKSKDLIGIPWRVAFALQADGWYLRSDCIWHKPNPMPESVTDRPTKAHEYLFLLAKSERYFYDADAIKEQAVNEGEIVVLGEKSFSKGQARGAGVEPTGNGKADVYIVPPGRNRRTVWTVTTQPYSEAHFATFPPALIEPCILAGCPKGGLVLDPFMGAGTTALVAKQRGRHYIGCDLNPAYVEMATLRVEGSGIDRLNAKPAAPVTDLPLFASLEGQSA